MSAVVGYPQSLFKYANDQKIAVKSFADSDSGWTGQLIKTSLIKRLDKMVEAIQSGTITRPVSVFFVGGPGNGKTAVAEYFIRKLYNGNIPPAEKTENQRLYFAPFANGSGMNGTVLVEDATAANNSRDAAQYLLEDVSEYVFRRDNSSKLYVCCVNRGILATSSRKRIRGKEENIAFLEAMSRSASVTSCNKSIWPIAGNAEFDAVKNRVPNMADVYIWPMDVESLFDEALYGSYEDTPAHQVLKRIFDQDFTTCASCEHKLLCPFYANAMTMRETQNRVNLIRVLHYFEIASGDKLQFRNVFAVFNALFVGSETDYKRETPRGVPQKKITPCEWVAEKVAHITRQDIHAGKAYFELLSRYYSYVLFSDLDEFVGLTSLFRTSDTRIKDPIDAISKIVEQISKRRQGKADTSGQKILREKFAKLMDVTLVEDETVLEAIEEAFCSTFTLGWKRLQDVCQQKSFTLSALEQGFFKCLCDYEKRIESAEIPVADSVEPLTNQALRFLKIFGCRLAKRAIGIQIPTVFEGSHAQHYCDLINSDFSRPTDSIKAERLRLKKLFRKAILNGESFDAPVMQRLGPIQPSHSVCLNLGTSEINVNLFSASDDGDARASKIGANAKYFNVRVGEYEISVLLTFDLYLALQKIEKGLAMAALPEPVSIKLNSISSRILGQLVHSRQKAVLTLSIPGSKPAKYERETDEEEFNPLGEI